MIDARGLCLPLLLRRRLLVPRLRKPQATPNPRDYENAIREIPSTLVCAKLDRSTQSHTRLPSTDSSPYSKWRQCREAGAVQVPYEMDAPCDQYASRVGGRKRGQLRPSQPAQRVCMKVAGGRENGVNADLAGQTRGDFLSSAA